MSVSQSQLPPHWGQILAFGVLLVLIVFAVFRCWFVQGRQLRGQGLSRFPSRPTATGPLVQLRP
ncbi:hypothetical protein [Streptomyces sp. NPDC051642]|uniref:hypothetical protein n=1 Tax=unclassified Streptomyces TaxID=2593676 RepID=UPI0034157771